MKSENKLSPVNLEYLLSQIGDEKIVMSIVRKYRNHLRTLLENLQKELHNEDYREVHRIAHSIKGGASNLGAESLQKSARHLEAKARIGYVPNKTGLYEAIYNDFRVVDACISDLLKE